MLTLILQTHDGQEIELSIQLEDTFADLKSQYSNDDGLSDSLERLITNGAYVSENTKIVDYIRNSANEWLSVDHSVNAIENGSQATIIETQVKECCVQGCGSLTSIAAEKLFYPLPTDHDRLAGCLMEIGRPELYNQIIGLNTETSKKYYLCSSHYSQETISSLPLNTAEHSAVSLLKPKNERMWIDTKLEVISSKEDNREVVFEDEDSALELKTDEDFEHPGILCRLCGESTANPINLYSEQEENEEFSLADKINLCLPVTITITDPLPKQICENCRVKLNTCHELALCSLQTEDKLRLLLREKKLSVNDTAEKQCPLCLEGDMAVKKSGIYRKDDLENESRCSGIAKQAVSCPLNVFSHENCNSRSPSRIFTDNSTTEVTATNVSQVQHDDASFLFLEKEFPCSICSAKIDVTSIRTHQCSPENRDLSHSCLICNNTNFTYPHELEIHYRHHGLFDEKFTCDLCSYECEDLEEAAEHVKICRPKCSEIRCDTCCKVFSNIEMINDHQCHQIRFDLREVTDNNRLKCTTKLSTTRKKQGIKYDCFFCQKQFSRKRNLQNHISASHIEEMCNSVASKCYKCKICNEAFARDTDAEVHITLRHNLEPFGTSEFLTGQEFTPEELTISRLYVCEYCDRCFTVPNSLHDHRNIVHERSDIYTCLVCESTFDSHRQLTNHKSTRCQQSIVDIPGVRRFYVCKYCDKALIHYSSLSSHVLQHQDIAPYLCRPCNVHFETYKDIAVHRDIVHPYLSTVHERAKRSYKCQYCQKQFSYEVALVKHIRIHTGERPYKCMICGKGFTQSSGLNTHLKIHSDLRPYNCSKCPQTFKIKGDRDNHVKKHSGVRPYKCDLCTKSFMTQHVFSQHRKIHTNDRPYKCDLCDEAFRRSHVLTVHRRIHTGEKPHTCDICPKSYRQRGDLLKHRKVQHGINLADIAKLSFGDNYTENSYNSFAKSSNVIADRRGGNSSLLLPL